MKKLIVVPFALVGLFLAPVAQAQKAQAPKAQAYVGVITDTMCGRDHKAMKVSPDAKCVRDCVGDGKTYKYALADARGIYTLSDQETPKNFAGAKVKVTGVLYPKTNILKVEKIEKAK
jgi:hypothetical protein